MTVCIRSRDGFSPLRVTAEMTNLNQLEFSFHSYKGETTTCSVDSWTSCEELANLAVQNHGVDNTGWTITLWNQLDGLDAIVTETSGFDYVLDLISEMELTPAFPSAKNVFMEQRKNSFPAIKKREVLLGLNFFFFKRSLPLLINANLICKIFSMLR